jgi:metal-dependent amidase/aminoacylase/carboxypeptidase family protein
VRSREGAIQRLRGVGVAGDHLGAEASQRLGLVRLGVARDRAQRERSGAVGEDGVREAPLMMGAEDFSYFLEAVPGAFWFVGSQNAERGLVWGHHHPRFDLDEAALAVGMESMVNVALRYLNEGA